MPAMNAAEFIAKWRPVELRERQACQEHFLDLCELVGHPKPAEMDPRGERFCFERGAKKLGGEDGWADVWKRGYFGWEYKGRHKDLKEAYRQLNGYREALENPPLLVVCDIDRIEIHTNFTNTAPQVTTLAFDDLATAEGLRTLRALFFDPERLRPTAQRQLITEKAAGKIGDIARALRERGVEPRAAARFLDRLVFCMFAEDVRLLPNDLFTRTLRTAQQDARRLASMLADLFRAMADGGFFGVEEVKRFNGNLFTDAEVIDLRPDEIAALDALAATDWSDVEPAIFGTLFERGLDPDKRSQIGAHYTSREDIETLVEPVVMAPLRREWEETRTLVLNVLATGKKHPDGKEKPLKPKAVAKARLEADTLIRNFLDRLAFVKVLDPACGSGNFLYVTLGKLLDLEREAGAFADAHGIGGHFPRVDPRQLSGIEINPYASALAQMTVWIGYLQWMSQHGYPWPADPVLKPMDTIRCQDAILDLTDPEHPKEPEWPKTDFIVSNPPFLGDRLMRGGLGDDYVDSLRRHYSGRVPGGADLCCYWFEKARAQVEAGACQRAGLLATQGIRGGQNRKVLERIKQTGDIFFAESDRPWVLDGANVHVSMVSFDGGDDDRRVLDGLAVQTINANLTTSTDLTGARRLVENRQICFYSDVKAGRFEIGVEQALRLLLSPNPNGRPTSDIVIPWANGADVLRRPTGTWIIDFGVTLPAADACQYESAFAVVERRVRPQRETVKRKRYRDLWWLHAEPCAGMREGVRSLKRFIVSPSLSKHRVFTYLPAPTLADHQLMVVARDDDYFFGVLHSRVHEVWARAQGTQLRERESGFRYTPTTCVETFPFPWPPGNEPKDDPRVRAIAAAARELDELRERWLNPPEWTKEEVLEFPGSADGPWSRYVHDPDERGIGTVRWPRTVPKDAESAAKLKQRTLTNLYNARPAWLAHAHTRLDAAVLTAYGWPPDLADEALLESLLSLNLQRANFGEGA
jgi:type II restriction/modification system DNA methylase subunit YeeA